MFVRTLIGGLCAGFICLPTLLYADWEKLDTAPANCSNLAYAPDADVLMVFSYGNQGYDFWIFRDNKWSLLNLPGPQSNGYGSVVMAYDGERKKFLVCFSRRIKSRHRYQVWSWDLSTWEKLLDRPAPGLNEFPDAMIYHPGEKRILMLSEHLFWWDWDNAKWDIIEGISFTHGTQGMFDSYGMVYHNKLNLVVISHESGLSDRYYRTDLLQWDGNTLEDFAYGWPKALDNVQMAYDTTRDILILRGVHLVWGVYEGRELWEFEDNEWKLRSKAPLPPGVEPMYYNANKGETIIPTGSGSMWTWDGQALKWLEPITPSNAYSVFYDPRTDSFNLISQPKSRNSSVVHQRLELWALQNEEWKNLKVKTPRFHTIISFYDSSSGRAILIGNGTYPNVVGPDWPAYSWSDQDRWKRSRKFENDQVVNIKKVIYDAPRRRYLYFCGAGNIESGVHIVWSFDGKHWRKRFELVNDPPLVGADYALNYQTGGIYLIFPGTTLTGEDGSVKDVATNNIYIARGKRWKQVETAGRTPSPRREAKFVQGAEDNAVYLIGGREVTPGWDDYYYDLWRLDLTDMRWELVNRSLYRMAPISCYSTAVVAGEPPNRRIILFNKNTWVYRLPD
jgi:hypothetical protein